MAKLETKEKIQQEIDSVYGQLEDVYKRLENGELDSHYDSNARNSILGNKIKLIGYSLLMVGERRKKPQLEKK